MMKTMNGKKKKTGKNRETVEAFAQQRSKSDYTVSHSGLRERNAKGGPER